MGRNLLLILAVLGCCTSVQADPLKGGVQHEDRNGPLSGELSGESDTSTFMPAGLKFDETVEPIKGDLKVHKLFSSIEMPAEDKDDTWYKIPKWRAGEFHREKQTNYNSDGIGHESVSKADHVYGMQMDKNGDIWHHMSWPRITKVSSNDGSTQIKIINKYEPVSLNDTEFCVKISSTNIDVDDKTGKIIRLAKQEEFDRYFPIAKGVARGNCIIQGFSHHGRPNTEVEKCSVEEHLVKPFAVVNTFRGKNLRESFRNFLQSHELASLIPD
ncbi:MAG: hypothetical protein K2X29_03775 [Candidatus Obscuribacterales bacterium]|nr:hypothetical protein [Candidatus Obscuribacterales bacterium]